MVFLVVIACREVVCVSHTGVATAVALSQCCEEYHVHQHRQDEAQQSSQDSSKQSTRWVITVVG